MPRRFHNFLEMNVIFALVTVLSLAILIFTDPETVLAAMMNGGTKALELSLKMAVIYAVWFGIFEVLKRTGLSEKIAKLLKPVNRFLFGSIPEEAGGLIALNMSANILGVSGATTPFGIKATHALLNQKEDYTHAVQMFFVINATSIQLIPASIISLRTSLGSANPSDILLPTILATLLSTVVGVLLMKVFRKRKQP